MWKRHVLVFSLAFLVTACSGITYGPSKPDPDTEFAPNVYNAKEAFVDFWQAARDVPFEQQMELWDNRVETKYHRFYDSAVYQKQRDPKWESQKQAKLKEFFTQLPRLYDGMLVEFGRFDGLLVEQLKKFKATFPDATFKGLDIYVAPSLLSFNGHTDTYLDEPKTDILGFGIDLITSVKDDPEVRYPNELFQIYHERAMGIPREQLERDGTLVHRLWREGLAMHVSGLFNPGKTDALLLKDQPLAATCAAHTARLAKRFLRDAKLSLTMAENTGVVAKWFGGEPSNDRQIPQKAAYCLGLVVARRLAQTHELKEMVKWNLGVIETQVLGTLRAL